MAFFVCADAEALIGVSTDSAYQWLAAGHSATGQTHLIAISVGFVGASDCLW